MHRPHRGQLVLLVSLGAVLVVLLVTVTSLAATARLATLRRPAAAPPATAPPAATPLPAARPFVPPSGPAAEVCVNVAAWPLDRRLEQLLFISAVFGDLESSLPPAEAGVGGFVIFGQPDAAAAPGIARGLASMRAAAAADGEVAPWMSTDEEGGYIQRLAHVVGPLPAPRQMPVRWTPDQARAALTAHAAALRALGIDMDLAPVLDVAPPGDQVADEADRAFSDDPAVVSDYGIAYLAGLRDGGVTAVVKHFPGLGHADANTDLAAATDPPLRSLEGDDLLPFGAAVAAQVPVVMIGHVRVPGLSGLVPASLSPATYRLLRADLHFTGVAMTDALDAKAISAAGYTQPGAVVAAIRAGADIAMIDAREWQPALSALRGAVRVGTLPEAVVNGDVGRILTAKGLEVCSPTGG